MKYLTKVWKVHSSNVVTVPKPVSRTLRLEKGDVVEVQIRTIVAKQK